ncbi:MAG: potassium channel family protein [Deltaproteobacteria bacterium]|nr:potassium channel family protein [Deltaproteobacteria bacterium]
MIHFLSIRFKFRTLLIFLFMLAVIDPIFTELGKFGLNFLDVIFTIFLLTALYSVSGNRKTLLVGVILVAPIFFLGWSGFAKEKLFTALLIFVFGMAFFGFVATSILIHILAEESVTVDLIYGSACVYFLIGFFWSVGYGIIELIIPGSFSVSGHVLTRADYVSHYGFLNDNLSYFSFVTLTTLGYGDIVPVSGPAKTFSTLEAILGQLYIALLVARLVGLHTAQSIANKGREKIVVDEYRPFLERDQGDSQKEQ